MSDPRPEYVQWEALKHERNVLQKICAERADEIERLRAALGTIRGLAYSDAPAEGLEDAQNDLRQIYEVAVRALT